MKIPISGNHAIQCEEHAETAPIVDAFASDNELFIEKFLASWGHSPSLNLFVEDILNHLRLLGEDVVLLCYLNDLRISECFLLSFVSSTLSFHGMECCNE